MVRSQAHCHVFFPNLKLGPEGRRHVGDALYYVRRLRWPREVRRTMTTNYAGDVGEPLELAVRDEAAHHHRHQSAVSESPQVMHEVGQGIENRLAFIYLDRLGLVRVMAYNHVGAGIDGEMPHLLLVFHNRQVAGAGIRLDLIGR